MTLTRRNMLVIGAGAFAAAGLGALPALAATTEELIADFTGGAATGEGGLTLTAPEIAGVLGAMAGVVDIIQRCFTGLEARDYTRATTAGTQNVVAVAQMADGSFQRAQAEVKVTIGGCGG